MENSLSNKRSRIEAYLREKNSAPLTELPNRLTTNIDLCESGAQIVELLKHTDREILDGWPLEDSINGASTTTLLVTEGLQHDLVLHDKLARLAHLIRQRVSLSSATSGCQRPLKIVLSGCGTSGRIAYLCTRTFNAHVARDVCEYTIAGGDWALVNSVESVEDNPDQGRSELKELVEKTPNADFIYVGITCGLSAPYVAGQLSFCMDELEKPANTGESRVLACALIGFNPIEMARRTQKINERGETFFDLLGRMNSLELARPHTYFVLNPLIGPEPVTGSSRMKSGTATKIMLDIVLSLALLNDATIKQLRASSKNEDKCGYEDRMVIWQMIECYRRVMNEVVYAQSNAIGSLIDRAAVSLRTTGGSINYLADDERLGFIACVDASECVPTYGANKDDIKGFVASANGESLSSMLKGSNAWSSFIRTCHPVQSQNVIDKLADFDSPASLFIIIRNDEDDNERPTITNNKPEGNHFFPTCDKIVAKLKETNSKCQMSRVSLSASTKRNQSVDNSKDLIELVFHEAGGVNVSEYFAQCLQELALKLVLNAISTGAHVLVGKTYENIMVDVRVSNVKLFYRALGILARLGGQEREKCELCLLKAIYDDDDYENSKFQADNVAKHIESATSQTLVVPRALVMLLTGCSAAKARDILTQSNNSVRNCIYKLKNSY